MALLTQVLGRIRAAWRVLWGSRQLERDMQDEMRLHIEMEAERLTREIGLDPVEARRRAHVHFGGIEAYKEAGRDVRGRGWLDAMSVDFRLGVRMLVKHRGLTLTGGFAMAVAIGIGATAFETLGELITPSLPFDEGDQVVSIQYSAANAAARDRGVSADFAVWRDRLTSIVELGAFRTVQHNLIAPPAMPEPIKLAEMTASGFAIARTAPVLGRYLLPADEDPTTPPVIVIGFRTWLARFAGDPGIVGRVVNLGGVAHTIVGVMPDDFGFPFDHQFWIPFRLRADHGRLDGPTIYVFGRLGRGVSMEQAQAELATIAGPADDASGDRRAEPARAVVVPYTHDHVDLAEPGMVVLVRAAQLFTGALTFVVAINLAILFYARTVTRTGELSVRTALGASRARLLSQLFLEALALALVGAAAGLGLSSVALGYLQAFARAAGGVPYWIRFDLSSATVAAALGLSIIAALIMGVLPGLKVTGRRLNANLNALNGRSGTRLGAIWTTLVVLQVAAAVAVLPAACYLAWQTALLELQGPQFAAEKFVVTTLAMPTHDRAPDPSRLADEQRAILTRLRAEPSVAAATFSSNVPGFAAGARIEFDGRAVVNAPPTANLDVSRMDVAADMLDVYETDVLAGRRLAAGDVGTANVVVNRTFARWLSGNGTPLGARFRYGSSSVRPIDGAWFEIIGVVRDFPEVPDALNLDTPAVVFHAAAPGTINPAIVSVRFDRDVPAGFTDRMKHIAAEVDPALQMRQPVLLQTYYDRVYSLWRYLSIAAALATLSVLVLSAAGMYALMSFTVAQRTREIGIRIALGARPRRLLFSIFGRALRQLTLGVVAGSIVSGLAVSAVDMDAAVAAGLLLAVASIMTLVGLLAAIGPARRSLRIPAADALRIDA
ncbi:MAG TPA: ABC transporter permease [Vicinamibacterales bacterium]|nr:ABC transporter permease [Vicinamibacterales bacterium]